MLRPPKAEARTRVRPTDNVSFVPMECLQINSTSLVLGGTRTLERVAGSYTYFADGDVLLAKITPCFENGKLGIARGLCNGVGFGSSEFMVLRPSPEVLSEWIYYYLAREEFRVSGASRMSGAVGHKRVPPEYVEECAIAVPPLPEQRRIVAVLDQAFAAIATAKANAERNMANARAVFESQVACIFAAGASQWTPRKLADVALDFGRGKSKHRPRNDPKLYGGKYPFIQTGDVRGADHIINEYSQTYNDIGLAQSKLWPTGTLCTIAANIAETAILGFDACFPDSVIGVVVDAEVTSNTFLEYLLRSVKARLKAQGKGSAQDNINLGTFEGQAFPFPDVKIQDRIVASLDELREATNRAVVLYEQQLAALDELKRSLLHHAFAGAL